MTVLINGTVNFNPDDAMKVLAETAQLMSTHAHRKAAATMSGVSIQPCPVASMSMKTGSPASTLPLIWQVPFTLIC